jgi:hypothetical protein
MTVDLAPHQCQWNWTSGGKTSQMKDLEKIRGVIDRCGNKGEIMDLLGLAPGCLSVTWRTKIPHVNTKEAEDRSALLPLPSDGMVRGLVPLMEVWLAQKRSSRYQMARSAQKKEMEEDKIL